MPRMFDILRNKGDDNDKDKQKDKDANADSKSSENKEKDAEQNLNFPREILKDNIKQDNQDSEDASLTSKKLISAVKLHGVDNEDKAKEIYRNAVELVKILLEKTEAGESLLPYADKISVVLEDIFNQLVLGASILQNIYERPKEEYYLPYHIVNVLILSSVLGLSMGFNKSRLSHLGMAAIFYDLGMDHFKEITSQPRKLTEEEYELIKTHISGSLNIVEQIGKIDEEVKEAIRMHHERVNGKGYPRGIKSDEIHPYAKIIGLVDSYESITNSRTHRDKVNAHEAVKFMLGSLKDYFDTEVMKIFINKMSVYPVGSIVKLNTKEIARVISVHSGEPLRPVVMVIQDSSGELVKERRIIDLSQQDFPTIQE